MFCRQCGSDHVRKLSLVFETGMTHVATRTSGIGIGPGVMVGAARTKGVHLTAVSQRAAPPAHKNAGATVGWALGLGLLGGAYHWIWLIALFVLAAGISQASWNRTTWPKLYGEWNRFFMCERCGWIGAPMPVRPNIPATPIRLTSPGTALPSGRVALEIEDGAQKLCPHCRSFIPVAATVCRYCQRDYPRQPELLSAAGAKCAHEEATHIADNRFRCDACGADITGP